MDKTAIIIVKEDRFTGMEGETALRVMRRLLRGRSVEAADIFETDRNNPLTVGDIWRKGYDVFVFISGILFITHKGIDVLSDMAGRNRDSVIGPVSNESRMASQRRTPPFFYQTLSVFKWATEDVYGEFGDTLTEVEEIDDFCFAFGKEILEGLPGERSVGDLPVLLKERKVRCGVAGGVYAHRYGNCYESAREDLLEYVPISARKVLDIGSARGLFGEMLKKRQLCSVTGIDMDKESVGVSRGRLDSVIHGNIEKIVEQGVLESYDCIVCGDVLEHLYDPWKVVRALRGRLKDGGIFIASTPNIMNWAVLYEQLKGRWDYIPFTILSGTHIRFFTKETLIELFEDAGYTVKGVHLQNFGIPPRGAELIAHLKKAMNEIDEEELTASEIVAVAEG